MVAGGLWLGMNEMGPQELGVLGEVWTMRQLQRAGLTVTLGGPADLLADGLPVEVKTARARRYRGDGRKGYQFCVSKPGHTDHKRAAVVICLCWRDLAADPVCFVIPSDRLGDLHKVVIPTAQPWTYSGKWARWYRRWETIADVMEGER